MVKITIIKIIKNITICKYNNINITIAATKKNKNVYDKNI